ncbi:hypothetical protein YC2023_016553 [Brassica napus]
MLMRRRGVHSGLVVKAMDSSGKPLKVTILVKAPINEKPDKKKREGEEEDGFTTKGSAI